MRRLSAQTSFWFCASGACDTVYFGDGLRFTREDLSVPVHQKDPGGDILICYCFGFTRSEIQSDKGAEIAKVIGDKVREGLCSCEVRNPRGACCLGDVRAEAG
jgi:hypothetical protein